jgi:hypothetical protein
LVANRHACGHDEIVLFKNLTFVAIAHVAIASSKQFVAFDVHLLPQTFSWLLFLPTCDHDEITLSET